MRIKRSDRIAAFQQRTKIHSPMFNHHSLNLGDHFGVDKKKSGAHFGVGIISGRFGDIFRVGDHFEVGIISGAVQYPLNILYHILFWLFRVQN